MHHGFKGLLLTILGFTLLTFSINSFAAFRAVKREDVKGPCKNIEYYDHGGPMFCDEYVKAVMYTTKPSKRYPDGKQYTVMRSYRYLGEHSKVSGFYCKRYQALKSSDKEIWRKCYLIKDGKFKGFFKRLTFYYKPAGEDA